MKKSLTIHHLEDETEDVRWIAGTLLNRYWLNQPAWIQDGGRFEEEINPRSASFDLNVGPDAYTIQHRLYESPDDFQSHANDIVPTDLVLLDLKMGRSDEMPGLDCYELAVRHVGQGRVYVLTAFPRFALEAQVPADHVIQKPPDPTSLIDTLVDALAIGGDP